MPAPSIRWPARFEPVRSPVHVRNELTIAAPATAIWAALIAAPQWPGWYANAHEVAINGGASELGPGARFTWKTFGVALRSTVEEFVPETRIAWLAEAAGVSVYHAWLITPTPGGCHVLTDETQHGVLARTGKLFFPSRMSDWHQRWLEGLAEKVRG